MAVGLVCRQALLSVTRPRAASMAIPLIALYVVVAVSAVHFTVPEGMLWVVRMIAAISGAVGFTMLCIVVGEQPVLARVGRDSLVFYAVNALSLNVGKLVIFKLLDIDAVHWGYVGQLAMGLATTAFAMLVMLLIDLVVQRYFWWSIGKDRPMSVSRTGTAE
ncbi:Acyltransferase [Bifidobacterium minimum]|uniref:Acyltransferase n=3 Tax=Bifidobacterium minimum TaxID=1693 RepID=A0A087BSC5_9BIFI|nr:Acyltransferase [Bifidobacterium minimum]